MPFAAVESAIKIWPAIMDVATSKSFLEALQDLKSSFVGDFL